MVVVVVVVVVDWQDRPIDQGEGRILTVGFESEEPSILTVVGLTQSGSYVLLSKLLVNSAASAVRVHSESTTAKSKPRVLTFFRRKIGPSLEADGGGREKESFD